MREGFEPGQLNASSSKSSAVEDDTDSDGGKLPEDLNEAQHWGNSDDSKGESSAEGKSGKGRAQFGSLEDRNVWDGHSGN